MAFYDNHAEMQTIFRLKKKLIFDLNDVSIKPDVWEGGSEG